LLCIGIGSGAMCARSRESVIIVGRSSGWVGDALMEYFRRESGALMYYEGRRVPWNLRHIQSRGQPELERSSNTAATRS
jgi:hypothetical protein